MAQRLDLQVTFLHFLTLPLVVRAEYKSKGCQHDSRIHPSTFTSMDNKLLCHGQIPLIDRRNDSFVVKEMLDKEGVLGNSRT
jgi:hypothetical protein